MVSKPMVSFLSSLAPPEFCACCTTSEERERTETRDTRRRRLQQSLSFSRRHYSTREERMKPSIISKWREKIITFSIFFVFSSRRCCLFEFRQRRKKTSVPQARRSLVCPIMVDKLRLPMMIITLSHAHHPHHHHHHRRLRDRASLSRS